MRRLVAPLLVALLLLAGCTGGDPDQVVRDAVASTFAGDFTFALTAGADGEAMAALGDDAGQVALALDGFALLGSRTSSGTQLALQVRGDTRLLELVTLTTGDVYVRTDAVALDDQGLSRLLSDLRASGAPDDVVTGVQALFAGDWVGIEGEAGLDGLLDEVVPGPDVSDDGDVAPDDVTALADLDLAGLLDTLVRAADVEGARDLPGGARRYPLTVTADRVARGLDAAGDDLAGVPVLGDLLGALEAGELAGDVVVRDQVVTSVELALAAGDVRAGQLQLVLDLDDHGATTSVRAPDAVVVAAEDLATALVALLTPGPS